MDVMDTPRRSPPFTMVPTAFLRDGTLPLLYRMAWATLRSYAWKRNGNTAKISVTTLADDLGVDSKTARRVLHQLEADKLITMTVQGGGGGRRYTPNQYTVHDPGTPTAGSPSVPGTPTAGSASTPTAGSPKPSWDSHHREPKKINSNKMKTKMKRDTPLSLVRSPEPSSTDSAASIEDVAKRISEIDPASLTKWEADLVSGVAGLLAAGQLPTQKQIGNVLGLSARPKTRKLVEQAKVNEKDRDEYIGLVKWVEEQRNYLDYLKQRIAAWKVQPPPRGHKDYYTAEDFVRREPAVIGEQTARLQTSEAELAAFIKGKTKAEIAAFTRKELSA